MQRVVRALVLAALVGGALALAGLGPAFAGDEATPLAAFYEALRAPVVVAEMEPPEKLTLGRAVILPRPGARLVLLAVSGRHCGYLLDGPARLVYQVDTPASVPIARHNLKRADQVEVRAAGQGLEVSTELTGAAVWGWDLSLFEEEWKPIESQALPDWLGEFPERFVGTNPARDLLLADRNGGAGFRWALLRARGDDFYLEVDPRPASRVEWLLRVFKIRDSVSAYAGRLTSELLISQPIGRSWWEAPAVEFGSVDTEIRVLNRRAGHISVATRTRIEAMRDGLQVLPFRLFSEVWVDGVDRRSYEISELLVDGESTDYLHRDGLLLVALPRVVKRGESVVLEAVAGGEILDEPAGSSYWRLGLGPWYPKPRFGGVEWSAFRVEADVLAPFVPFGPGKVVERGERDGRSFVRTKLDGPMEAAVVMAGRYKTLSEKDAGGNVHVSTYAFSKEKEARRLARVVIAIRQCLEGWLGVPYPFSDLNVIEVNEWGWGQAPPGVVFITKEAFLTRAKTQVDQTTRALSQIYGRGTNERVAHEVAHGWFPHVAKVVRGEETWLSESLAEYSAAVCLRRSMASEKEGDRFFQRQLGEWKSWSKAAGDTASVFLAGHLAGASGDGELRRQLLYGRGALLLHAVREDLVRRKGREEGDRLFFSWLRSYVKNFTYKAAESRYLIAILNQVTGEDWMPFFEAHLLGVEGPKIE